MNQTLADLVSAYLVEQCRVILEAEPQLRAREPVIHSTRVAVRRLRSTVRVFDELFDVAQAGELEDELVWYAGLLGAVRDLDILTARLTGQLAKLPPELVLGPVTKQVETELGVRHKQAWDELLATLDTERYQALTQTLQRWRDETPFTAAAHVPAAKVKRYVKRAEKKVRKRLAAALAATQAGEENADELLHRARKSGKRHRYAAELATPLLGAKADEVVETRKSLQDVLGEHQDSHVAAGFLRAEGARLGNRAGHNGFTYGLLYAQELQRQTEIGDRLRPFVN